MLELPLAARTITRGWMVFETAPLMPTADIGLQRWPMLWPQDHGFAFAAVSVNAFVLKDRE